MYNWHQKQTCMKGDLGMEWYDEIPDQVSGRKVPFVSIGRGMLDFNAVACELIGDEGQYRYAKIRSGRDENGKLKRAVQFLTDYEDNAIPIKKKEQKGKRIQGMTIVNKGFIGRIFGEEGTNEGMVRYKVELLDKDMLLIAMDDATSSAVIEQSAPVQDITKTLYDYWGPETQAMYVLNIHDPQLMIVRKNKNSFVGQYVHASSTKGAYYSSEYSVKEADSPCWIKVLF